MGGVARVFGIRIKDSNASRIIHMSLLGASKAHAAKYLGVEGKLFGIEILWSILVNLVLAGSRLASCRPYLGMTAKDLRLGCRD